MLNAVKIIQWNPRLTATSVIRSPRYYCQFFRPGKTAIHFLIKKPLMRLPVLKYVQRPHFTILNSRISYNFTLLIRLFLRNLENLSACDMSILLT